MFKNWILALIMAFSSFSALSHAEVVPLSDEAKSVKTGVYKHYKGYLYEVIGVSHHSETLEEFVTYRHLYGNYSYWVRPVKMFLETVVYENQEVPRFKYLGPMGGDQEY